jgi:hypothetical protein
MNMFNDIIEAGRKQAIADCVSLDENNWRKTEGPGMPYSATRMEWEKGYNEQKALIVERNRERLHVLFNGNHNI